MNEEGFFAVKFFRLKFIMNYFNNKKSLLIPVPAVAVIQEGQVVFIVIKFKGQVDGFYFIFINF